MTEIIDELKIAEPKGQVGDINKLKDVIRFILKNINSTKYKTEIVKLCFIIDYEYSKKIGGISPTTVKYVRYNYGPYSDYFVEAFEQLLNEKIIVEVALPFGIGYNLLDNNETELDENVKQFILSILKEYSNSTLKQMKEYIYNLQEFKETPFGQEIVLTK